jgi:DNA-binding NarL/FixJ family response regulator
MNHKLTERELDIIRLVAKGHTNRAIADKLQLSPATIKSHLGRMFEKLECTNRPSMVYNALERRYNI